MSTDRITSTTVIHLASGDHVRVPGDRADVEEKLGDSEAGRVQVQDTQGQNVTIYRAHVTHLTDWRTAEPGMRPV